MTRRQWLGLWSRLGLASAVTGASVTTTAAADASRLNAPTPAAASEMPSTAHAATSDANTPLRLTEAQWRERLTPAQFHVLRDHGTEPPGSSPLDREKRPGRFVCAGCALPLFTSAMKFDSGTGWPSFFTALPGALGTSRDFKLIWPRTEYHCARCGGHQGHVFKDGPRPTGLRYCNNGVALRFEPEAT